MKKRNALIILILAILCILPSCETENKHTVRFFVDNTVISTSEISNGSYVAIPPIPERENCIFRFWSSNGKDSFDFSKPITSDLDITAVYTKVQIPKNLTIFENGQLVGTGKMTYEKNKVIYSEYGLNEENPSRVITTIHDGNLILKTLEEHFNGVNLISSTSYESTYEGNQLISKQTTQFANNTTTILTEDYTYTENGKFNTMKSTLNGKPHEETSFEYIEANNGKRKEIISTKNLETNEIKTTTYYYKDNILTGTEITDPNHKLYTSVTYPEDTYDKQIQYNYVLNEESKEYEAQSIVTYIQEYDSERLHNLSSTTIVRMATGETTTTRYDWSPEVQDFLRLYPYAATSVSQQTGYEYEHIDKTSIATRRQSKIVWEMENTF